MTNAQQLVLRQDMATGLIKVGWAVDMPPGRFQHIDLIGESEYCAPLIDGNPLYFEYEQACQLARQANQKLLRRQADELLLKGWFSVPLKLCGENANTGADIFGSYQTAALHAIYYLTGNVTDVWAVFNGDSVIAIRSRQAPSVMEELEYQVWKHHTLNTLSNMQGEVCEGILIAKESGLWLCPQAEDTRN